MTPRGGAPSPQATSERDASRPYPQTGNHFCVCLKYFKSGGGWFRRIGIR